MTSMVERVARAIALRHWPDDKRWRVYVPAAEAAIAAMREPTDLMGVGISRLGADYRPGSHSATQLWRAMIDAALEEKP